MAPEVDAPLELPEVLDGPPVEPPDVADPVLPPDPLVPDVGPVVPLPDPLAVNPLELPPSPLVASVPESVPEAPDPPAAPPVSVPVPAVPSGLVEPPPALELAPGVASSPRQAGVVRRAKASMHRKETMSFGHGTDVAFPAPWLGAIYAS